MIMVINRYLLPFFLSPGVVNIGEVVAFIERTIANARDTITDGDTRQRGAISERRSANARDAIRDGDTRQRVEIIERRIANARDAIGNNKFCNQFTVEIQIFCTA